MSLALYMDQHAPAAITRGLRRRGADVLTAEEDGKADWDDTPLLDRAGELGRILFTRDSDFLVEAARRLRSGERFATVAYAYPLGVSIGGEHTQFIKRMGAELARRGLTTKLLLGDTAHGTSAALDFIRSSLADPAMHRYIGAVAFHTWRGCTAEVLPRWADAARQLSVPLLITESGPDAHLQEYPSVRLDPLFQLQKIELYVRCCAYGQPATIMEWQLTTDYSALTGAGIYGEPGPLKPTQRFWNLKQLGATPPGAFALPITTDRSDITCAAFGDLANGSYAVHIVNRGVERATVLAGLPPLHHGHNSGNGGRRADGSAERQGRIRASACELHHTAGQQRDSSGVSAGQCKQLKRDPSYENQNISHKPTRFHQNNGGGRGEPRLGFQPDLGRRRAENQTQIHPLSGLWHDRRVRRRPPSPQMGQPIWV